MQRARERFQSTPSVGRATAVCIGNGIAEVISIHALREEGDRLLMNFLDEALGISIHALREEGDS